MHILIKKRVNQYHGDTAIEIDRHESLPAALHAYATALRGGYDDVILAEELKPSAHIEVRLGDSGAVVPLASVTD